MALLYPDNFENKIGFDIIRNLLIDSCQSSLGVDEVERMHFMTDPSQIKLLLNQTGEAKEILIKGDPLPEISYHNLHAPLKTIKAEGAYLSVENLIKLKGSLQSFEDIKTFFSKKDGNESEGKFLYPCLAELFSRISLFPELINSIDRIIDKGGFVKDNASPELADVRQRLKNMQGSINRAIQRVFAQAVKEGIVDKDTAPSYRDGRAVIPVPASQKRNINGIIHDESATGKTVFIEPKETVEISNRIRELELEEQRIIIKILISVSNLIRPYVSEILRTNKLLGNFDFIIAKAKFAIEFGGEMPTINRLPEIDWYGAIHPALYISLKKAGKEIVPLNIRLSGKKRILIISGPNAGGKSVTLKTTGIIQYMFQCGMLPTVYSNSHMGVFKKIFIDIGDEQSLENDLSTYSSHLKNMRFFMLHADKNTLILIDEIGSGTEPTIGSSLAKAILTELATTRCFGIVTTHYHNLKRFAEETEEFINGAMLYDRQKLQPTFQLSIGTAGSSFALEIATKIGLPPIVIQKAKEEVGEEYVDSDRFLMEIIRDKKYWQSKRNNIKEKEKNIEQLQTKYENLIAELTSKRKEILKEAQNEAKQILTGANKKIENTISEIRNINAEKEKTKQIRKDLEEFKQKIEETGLNEPPKVLKNKISIKRKQKNEKSEPNKGDIVSLTNREIKVGDYVKMDNNNAIGKVMSIKGKTAELAIGQLRTSSKLDKLSLTTPPKEYKSSSNYNIINSTSSDASRQRMLEFKNELDLRGMRADEALDKLIHFLDDAIQFGVKHIRVLHGTGHGILRHIVRQQLSVTNGIEKYEDEDVRMGGTGITVITLK